MFADTSKGSAQKPMGMLTHCTRMMKQTLGKAVKMLVVSEWIVASRKYSTLQIGYLYP